MKNACKEMQDERDAEDDVGFVRIGDCGNKFRMKHSIDERWYSENEADEGTGGADVKERARRPNGGTQQDEGAEGAYQSWRGNEERIARVNVMMAASEEVPQLMRQKNEEQSQRKGETGNEGSRMAVEERETVREFIERDGLILRVSRGELSAGGKASA